MWFCTPRAVRLNDAAKFCGDGYGSRMATTWTKGILVARGRECITGGR
jgi:hypothetical protein